jgi:hypothetical protein
MKGDWDCPDCGALNPERYIKCSNCWYGWGLEPIEMNLEYVTFIKPVKLPTEQSELGALGCFRNSERDHQHPENDKPSWVIILKPAWVEISIADHVKERLGGNEAKDHVLCVPLQNIASFRQRVEAPKLVKSKPVKSAETQAPA